MVNTKDFAKRLKTVMEFYQLSAASFADKIGVQPSSISHLLSGRNKPSLDFVMKVIDTFQEIEIYWLLNGKGSFPKVDSTRMDSFSIDSHNNMLPVNSSKDIDRIIIFFRDGTFKNYTP